MINVKLLKIRHFGEYQAKKLRPFIEEADIFGLEQELTSGDIAHQEEMFWIEILESWSRSRFTRKLGEISLDILPIKEHRDYTNVTKDMLYRNKKLIWHSERFTEQESISHHFNT